MIDKELQAYFLSLNKKEVMYFFHQNQAVKLHLPIIKNLVAFPLSFSIFFDASIFKL